MALASAFHTIFITDVPLLSQVIPQVDRQHGPCIFPSWWPFKSPRSVATAPPVATKTFMIIKLLTFMITEMIIEL